MAGLFKARLQIISTYICIKIVYTICCKIMESGKLKIFFFCYGNGYMLRGGREREHAKEGGGGWRYHQVSPNTDNKEEREKEKGGGKEVQK